MSAWDTEAKAALDGVIRKSLEMRAVGLVTRDRLRPWRLRSATQRPRLDPHTLG